MKYLLLFFIFAATSCIQDDTVKTMDTGHNWQGRDIQIIEFDGCEYVRFGGIESAWGGHKGNCKNPVHK